MEDEYKKSIKEIESEQIADSCLENQYESEQIADSFLCCVCLDLLYKPIVLACGHASCFWCVHKSMSGVHVSHCPLCRHPYCHFPTICQMLHALILKMYPVTYKRREKQILEEEKETGHFSPNFDESFTSQDSSSPTDIDKTGTCIQHNISGSSSTALEPQTSCKDISHQISIDDVLCPTCKLLLFRPVALNCGHVCCESCLVPVDGSLKCQICQSPHPKGFPKVYLDLDHLLEERFTDDYMARKSTVQLKPVRFHHENQSNGSTKVVKNGLPFPAMSDEEFSRWCVNNSSNIHFGVGCDYCGMFPIIGERYKCKDCKETMGFDLCDDCYNTQSKLPGRFNQQHTSDHRFVLEKSHGIYNIILQLLRSQSNSGTPPQLVPEDEENILPSSALQLLRSQSNSGTPPQRVLEDEENILPSSAEIAQENTENLLLQSAELGQVNMGNSENVVINPTTPGAKEDQDDDTV